MLIVLRDDPYSLGIYIIEDTCILRLSVRPDIFFPSLAAPHINLPRLHRVPRCLEDRGGKSEELVVTKPNMWQQHHWHCPSRVFERSASGPCVYAGACAIALLISKIPLLDASYQHRCPCGYDFTVRDLHWLSIFALSFARISLHRGHMNYFNRSFSIISL